MKQKTFMMLKPDAFTSGYDQKVMDDLSKAGLVIVRKKKITVDMQVMKTLLDHYEEVIDSMDKEFNFPGKLFNTFYYDGPHFIMPMEVAYDGEEDIIAYSRKLVGKTNPMEANSDTIRGKYSNDNYDKAGAEVRLVQNVIHASDSKESAKRELALWSEYLLDE